MVSIIIPCYNAERFIAVAVRSGLDQTYPHREVIVVDDGSTDDSLKVLQGFGDAIRLETGPNRGGCAARNCGMEMAKGGLLQFHDADDVLHPEKLARQVPLAVQHRKAAVYCNYGFIDTDGNSIPANGHVAPLPSEGDPVEFVLLKSGISTPGPLLWREDVEAIGGFREHLSCAQERDLYVRLACHGLGFRHLPEELISIRRMSDGVSSNLIRVLDQHRDIVGNARDMLERSGGLTDERLRAMAGLIAYDARCYMRHGRPDRAMEYFNFAKELHAGGGISQAYPGYSGLLYRLIGPTWIQRLGEWRRKS